MEGFGATLGYYHGRPSMFLIWLQHGAVLFCLGNLQFIEISCAHAETVENWKHKMVIRVCSIVLIREGHVVVCLDLLGVRVCSGYFANLCILSKGLLQLILWSPPHEHISSICEI